MGGSNRGKRNIEHGGREAHGVERNGTVGGEAHEQESKAMWREKQITVSTTGRGVGERQIGERARRAACRLASLLYCHSGGMYA